jgi:UDP-N-acetylmuramate dehydrogenase
MQSLIAELQQLQISQLFIEEPLSLHTTWKIGGPAELLVIPTNKEELSQLIATAHKHHVAWTVLGRGSNVLALDRGIRGMVIKLGDAFDFVRFDGSFVTAGAAYSFIKLSVMTAKEGLTGLEYAGGIPGSVGGAVYMNAGAHGSDVSRVLQSAEVVTNNGELETWTKEQFQFAYRHSALHVSRHVVAEATFALVPGDRREIAAAMATYKDRRIRTQPLHMACAGSVFRNPEGTYAAKLIEEAGLKGMRIGGAEVSTLHANFIVNTGHATAEDVLALMTTIQQTVERRTGIRLIPEIMEMGER